MSWSIEFLPLVSWPVFGALAALGFALLLLLLWRSRRGALLRGLAFALLLLAIANPQFKREQRQPLKDIVAVVVDDSQSQAIAGRMKRTDVVQKELQERLAKIPNLDVRIIHSSAPEDSDRDGTFLFTDLNKALADIPRQRLAGVIMITDGEVDDVPKKAKDLGFKAPVQALITGNPNEFDRRLKLITQPRFGLVGHTQKIELEVTQTGGTDRGPVTLTITRQGQKPEVRSVAIGQKISVPVKIDHAGPNIVEVAAAVAPGELTPLNNRAVLTIDGIRQNLRVLLVSGEPYPGERTWRNMLKSDASVDLVHFTILRPPNKQDGTPISQLSLIAFPTRELFQEKLDQFDLIIFDRYELRGVLPLAYLENVAEYVQSGGAVLVACGDEYATTLSLYRTPLAQILPAVPTGQVIYKPYRPTPTKLGLRHPVTEGLPGGGAHPTWGSWFRTVVADPNKGQVLLKGADGKPLLVLGKRGKGRVALLLSDQSWLWARGFQGGGPYTDLLRRLAHWLMKEPDLNEEQLDATSRGQTILIERRSIKDTVSPVTVTGPTGKTQKVTLEKTAKPGIWRKSLKVGGQGIYKISSGKLASVVTVGNADTHELSAVTATKARLDPLLAQTGGGAFWVGRNATDAKPLPRIAMLGSGEMMHGADWLGLHRRNAYRVEGTRLFPLFAGFPALLVLIGIIALTWYREGR